MAPSKEKEEENVDPMVAMVQFMKQMMEDNRNFQTKILEKIPLGTSSEVQSSTVLATPAADRAVDALYTRISTFNYSKEDGETFDVRWSRFRDQFEEDAKEVPEATKIRILMQKLACSVHEEYLNHLLPKTPKDYTLKENVETLTKMYGKQTSLFSRRYDCLQLTKSPVIDYHRHATVVNAQCEEFGIGTISNDEFKVLIYLCSLKAPEDEYIRSRVLQLMESNSKITLPEIDAEVKRIEDIKQNARLIGQDNAIVSFVRNNDSRGNMQQKFDRDNIKNRCNYCNRDSHSRKYCPAREAECNYCHRQGHFEEACYRKKNEKGEGKRINAVQLVGRQVPRRYYTDVRINGKWTKLHFDTGSDITIVSEATWKMLGRPVLSSPEHNVIAANGGALRIIGQFECRYSFQDEAYDGIAYVNSQLNVLGWNWMENLPHFIDRWNKLETTTETSSISMSSTTIAPVRTITQSNTDDQLDVVTSKHRLEESAVNQLTDEKERRLLPFAEHEKVGQKLKDKRVVTLAVNQGLTNNVNERMDGYPEDVSIFRKGHSDSVEDHFPHSPKNENNGGENCPKAEKAVAYLPTQNGAYSESKKDEKKHDLEENHAVWQGGAHAQLQTFPHQTRYEGMIEMGGTNTDYAMVSSIGSHKRYSNSAFSVINNGNGSSFKETRQIHSPHPIKDCEIKGEGTPQQKSTRFPHKQHNRMENATSTPFGNKDSTMLRNGSVHLQMKTSVIHDRKGVPRDRLQHGMPKDFYYGSKMDSHGRGSNKDKDSSEKKKPKRNEFFVVA